MTNVIVLGLAIWLVVSFVWSFWPQYDSVDTTSITKVRTETREFDLNKVVASNLFGTATSAPVQAQQITAPVTRLKIKLRGVYSSDDDYASAMIEHNNKQEVYLLGAKLPGASNLTLYRVLSDRIIMSRSGKYETLYIEDFDGSKTATILQREPTTLVAQPATIDSDSDVDDDRNVVDKRNDARVSEELVKLRESLTDPEAINNFITVTPVMDEGNFTGFRVAPGKDRALFGRVGLRRNDIITEVNGISMDNPAAGVTIFEQITTADEITLSVQRGDRDITILLSTTTGTF